MEGLEITEISCSNLNNESRLDAEYFKKTSLCLSNKIKSKPYKHISEFAYVTDGIHTAIDYCEISNVNLISATSPRENVFDLSRQVFISEAAHLNNPRTALKEGDVIVSTVGTIGNCAVIDKTILPANSDRHVGIIRIEKDFSAYFLSTFLLSKYGKFQTLRESTGNVQLNLFLYKIKELIVPFLTLDFQAQIEVLVKEAHSKIEESKSTYAQAETLLLDTLGLADFSPSTEKVNIKSFKDSFAATGRLDAEYYQPKFDQLEAKLTETHTLHLLSDFLTINQRGTQPDYAEEEGLPVINSKHVREGEVILSDNRLAKIPDKESPLLIKKGDVLINGTGVGTIGRAAPYLHDQQAIPDNHVTVLRTDKLNPIYLAVYLNSIAGKYQVDKYFKGSSGQIELYPTDIDKFYVPFVNENIQTQIADLVQESFTLKAESELLLDVAKRAVEIAIETDERAAMIYLEQQT